MSGTMDLMEELIYFARWVENMCEDNSLSEEQLRYYLKHRAGELVSKATLPQGGDGA